MSESKGLQNLLFDFDHNKLEFLYGTLFRFEWFSLMTFEEIVWLKKPKVQNNFLPFKLDINDSNWLKMT